MATTATLSLESWPNLAHSFDESCDRALNPLDGVELLVERVQLQHDLAILLDLSINGRF